ncbi:phosphoglycerate mutase-like protein [Stipitochalara longipes BDJ]|nr:phosphoglycerate mutase-like protein [Stipitochalara longipes BDJ]
MFSSHQTRSSLKVTSRGLIAKDWIRAKSVTPFRPISILIKKGWPYCGIARQLASVGMAASQNLGPETLKHRQRVEPLQQSVTSSQRVEAQNQGESLCEPGELTDRGRVSALALGQKLRDIYVGKDKLMPTILSNTEDIYLRSTHIPRALHSLQQVFWGMFPPLHRSSDFKDPPITIRDAVDENLYPNRRQCQRLSQLKQGFAQRAAQRWNDTEDMAYINKLFSRWMPDHSVPIAVNSVPSLYQIKDFVDSSVAHDRSLPDEFYDDKARQIMNKISMEEWFAMFIESREYRTLAVGTVMGEIHDRMRSVIRASFESNLSPSRSTPLETERFGKLALIGCHDTTIVGILSSLGVFDQKTWPALCSHIAVELLEESSEDAALCAVGSSDAMRTAKAQIGSLKQIKESLLPGKAIETKDLISPVEGLPNAPGKHYVRIRYNDHLLKIPGCNQPGKNFMGDATLCTWNAFKEIVDSVRPKDWQEACRSNLDRPLFLSKGGSAST